MFLFVYCERTTEDLIQFLLKVFVSLYYTHVLSQNLKPKIRP